MKKQSKKSAADKIKELIDGKKEVQETKTEKLILIPEKPKKKYYVPKGGNGGIRPGAGRPMGGMAMQKRIIRGILYEHFVGSKTIKITNPKTGKTEEIQKPTALLQIEKLFLIGQQGEGSADAIDKWFSRAIGKSAQPIVGDEDDDPVQLDVGIGRMIHKAYGEPDSRPESA